MGQDLSGDGKGYEMRIPYLFGLKNKEAMYNLKRPNKNKRLTLTVCYGFFIHQWLLSQSGKKMRLLSLKKLVQLFFLTNFFLCINIPTVLLF